MPEIAAKARAMADGQLAGKIIVITGAGRGIGFAIASLFSRENAQCVMLVRNRNAGEKAAKALAGAEHAPIVLEADITNERQLTAAAAEVKRRFGHVDIVVNNSGVLLDEDRASTAGTMKDDIFERTLAVNLYGAIHTCRAFVPLVRKDGRIINVSSTMGQLSDGSAGYAPAYCISKTALNAYTTHLAEALQPQGIMVDCFHPGWARTDMGGPSATVDPKQSAHVALFLATRPHSPETGKFWRHPGVVIDW